mmetsp:Transcript_78592/g.163302  ORF Transcript_78592/g.163302 Transcript_78592/m.163302 type:complete len:237 (+) Transcript_78592:88-798(+)|eukprot:CAMPEP_0206493942 /NCGR_PEP_ID=MMETSP0324_2-20121206/47369_1 /ASSEMBLY_ACC=CAM_ASM_000836 /TAXON_ID=2866 /ORGANISM="Crypthecodinium cohnii, Strain Seligo" /LENGTH=236 /DNA_ID=CAMNT_0053977375 /DNA_START=28 /DNA_END=738 /DNA_ORIENTATION=+
MTRQSEVATTMREAPSTETSGEGHREYQNFLFKTKLCNFYPQGRCTRGAQCRFAHGDDELWASPDFSRIEMCRFATRPGGCRTEDCRFAHSTSELRPREKAMVRVPLHAQQAQKDRGPTAINLASALTSDNVSGSGSASGSGLISASFAASSPNSPLTCSPPPPPPPPAVNRFQLRPESPRDEDLASRVAARSWARMVDARDLGVQYQGLDPTTTLAEIVAEVDLLNSAMPEFYED